MARKSRKQTVTGVTSATVMPVINYPMIEKIPTAIYGRLSVEDKESDASMEVQIALVQDFINRSDELEYVDTYFDNGFTGTNFNRPAFTQLMNDVRQKKIRCIVVKDLSRFGRSYLEAGYYIETIFPFLGVRLIAVTDNFDSSRREDRESIALPIKNMVNAMYAKDISKKIWTSKQRQKEAGYALGNYAPYGYIRNHRTKRNEIDPEAAFYVQLIFQWKLMGIPVGEIAKRLQMLQAPTPSQRQCQISTREKAGSDRWNVTTLRNILGNQTYVGDTVSNKTNQALFAGKEQTIVDAENWLITKNTHPPIIARDDYEKVQQIMAEIEETAVQYRAASKEIREKYQNDLKGMVFCADCGSPMNFERLPHGTQYKKKICYYICKARWKKVQCIGHQITEQLLKMLVMDQVHLFVVKLSDKRKIVEALQQSQTNENPVYRAKGKVISVTDKITQINAKREKLYADYVSGIVDTEDFQMIKADYARQLEQMQEQLKEAEKEKQETEKRFSEYLEVTAQLQKHLDNHEFDAELVKALVQKIEVSADQHICITFRFHDIFEDYHINVKEGEEQ